MKDLQDLVKSGVRVIAYVDNDVVSFYDAETGEDELLSLHPSDVMVQALALLSIEAELV